MHIYIYYYCIYIYTCNTYIAQNSYIYICNIYIAQNSYIYMYIYIYTCIHIHTYDTWWCSFTYIHIWYVYNCIYIYGGFLKFRKWWYPQIIYFNGIFAYEPSHYYRWFGGTSILGNHDIYIQHYKIIATMISSPLHRSPQQAPEVQPEPDFGADFAKAMKAPEVCVFGWCFYHVVVSINGGSPKMVGL